MRGRRREQGTAFVFDPALPRVMERDTFTCSHCQRIVMLHDEQGRQIDSVLCMRCDKRICVPCAEQARCDPFEKKLSRMESKTAQTAQLFRAMGE